jgi:hypothetical protein
MMLRNAAAVALTLLFAHSALALDGIDLSEPATEPPAAGECPPLIKIKYPFLTCGGDDASHTLLQARPLQLAPSWASARQSPLMSDWTESDGYWGPDLNQD